MFAAADKKGGVDGVSHSVGKDFADADKGDKLPERKSEKDKAERRYRKKD